MANNRLSRKRESRERRPQKAALIAGKSRSKQAKIKKLLQSSQAAERAERAEQEANTETLDKKEEDLVRERKRAEFFAEPEAASQEVIFESFVQLSLSRPLLKAIAELGWTQPTLIQQKAVPLCLRGLDICGAAVTGSGKTGAFMIPVIERLRYRSKKVASTRVLVILPTRELGSQVYKVATSLAKYTDITFALCVGGLSISAQEAELRKRPDVVIATPGRLIDHIRNSASFSVQDVEILIMDEADRMLEEGFQEELDEIISFTPKSRQTMLFSATMTENVDDLIKLSLNKPVRLFVHSTQAFAERLEQEFIRIRKNTEEDRTALLLSLCDRVYKSNVIVFFQSKKAAHHAKIVFGLLGYSASELHGDLNQAQRLNSLEEFRNGESKFLLATDLASRGIDISGVQTVINYDMPSSYSQYVHRVGRTARGEQGGR